MRHCVGCEIPPATQIGEDMCLTHGTSTVMGDGCSIGAGFRLVCLLSGSLMGSKFLV